MLKEIIGQGHIVERLQHFVEKKSLPHCLFAGPAGVGKTTAALCIANELYGEQWRGNFLEMNASDERGIDTIRVKVKEFARTIPMGNAFKIVYLDEADSLTKDAQHALRRTMENYSDTCRFILACNYSGKIIPPIQSRCAVFRFSGLQENLVVDYLKDIAQKESVTADDAALRAVFFSAEGDLRKAINILQMASTEGSITQEAVYRVINQADPKEIRNMIDTSFRGNFSDARKSLLSLLYEKGLAAEDIVKQMNSQVMEMQLDDRQKLTIIEKIGEYEFRLTEGSNPQIQLEALLAQIALVGAK